MECHMNKRDITTLSFHTTPPCPHIAISGAHPRLSSSGGNILNSTKPGGSWLRVKEMKPRYGIGRTRTYELINGNLIRSVSDTKKGNIRGIRLIHGESVEAYLGSLANGTDQKISPVVEG